MTKQPGPILGTTLYSFTNEWQQRLYTLDSLMEKVARLGLGPAVEVVGFQTFRDYPDVSDDTARHFRGLLDRYELRPSCLAANVDIGRRRGQRMTPDEMVAYVERQLASAQKLGFPVLRIQHSVGPAVMERLAPLADRFKIQVACELHSPLVADHPAVIELRECYDRVGSPYLGFVPDFSSTMTAVPAGYWQNLRDAGAPEGLIDAAQAIWLTDRPVPEKFEALAQAAARFGAGPDIAGRLNLSMTMFGHAPVAQWTSLLPYTRHIHGKYYLVNEAGYEPSIPYPELMALLQQAGYPGTVSAEWEGQAFTEEPIGFQQVQAWRAMCDRLLAR